MLNPSSQQSAGANSIDMPYIGKPEKEFGGVDLFFGGLFIKKAVEQMKKNINPIIPRINKRSGDDRQNKQ